MSYIVLSQITSLRSINYIDEITVNIVTKQDSINIAKRQCKYIGKIQLLGGAKTTEFT
jgi:hypothetical protein